VLMVGNLNLMVNCPVTIQTIDDRTFTGKLKMFDKHMNLVLTNTVESRVVKTKTEPEGGKLLRRELGMIVLRGEQVLTYQKEGDKMKD
jgi:small nuclear ribonucleoprotein B and B'